MVESRPPNISRGSDEVRKVKLTPATKSHVTVDIERDIDRLYELVATIRPSMSRRHQK